MSHRYNPNDSPLMRRLQAVERLLRGNAFESASFGRGGIRVHGGGSIRIQGGGSLYIEGGGGVSVTGSGFIRGDGEFDWTGTFKASGDSLLDGDVEITKTLDVRATTRLRGETDLEADLNVTNEGKILVGDMTIDPTVGGGAVTFPNGARLVAGTGLIQLVAGLRSVILSATSASLVGGGTRVVASDQAIQLVGVNEATALDGLKWLAIDEFNRVWKVSPGTGGPMGQWEWPFPLTTVTSEFGMRPTPEGPRHHNGIDFGVPEGTPIPAASSGTVIGKGFGNSSTDGRGHWIVIRHVDGSETHYFHMIATSPLSVGATVSTGTTVGQVGNTGNSFGAHLHFETHEDGVGKNPRTFMAARGAN